VRGLACLSGLSFVASPKPENAFLGTTGPRAGPTGNALGEVGLRPDAMTFGRLLARASMATAMSVDLVHDLGRSNAIGLAKLANDCGVDSRIAGQRGKLPPPHFGIGFIRGHCRSRVRVRIMTCRA
jgi:hypothetical protein